VTCTRDAAGAVLSKAFAGRDPERHTARFRGGFLTAVKLYAAAVAHPRASEPLRRTLFDIAVSRVELVDTWARVKKGA
jgi:hypothetical protein